MWASQLSETCRIYIFLQYQRGYKTLAGVSTVLLWSSSEQRYCVVGMCNSYACIICNHHVCTICQWVSDLLSWSSPPVFSGQPPSIQGAQALCPCRCIPQLGSSGCGWLPSLWWQVSWALLTLRRPSGKVIEGTWVAIQYQHLGKVVFFILQVVLGVGEGTCPVVQAPDQIPLDMGCTWVVELEVQVAISPTRSTSPPLAELSFMARKPYMPCRQMLTSLPSDADSHQQNGRVLLVSAMFNSPLEQAPKCNYTIAFWVLQQSDAWLYLSNQSPHWVWTTTTFKSQLAFP